MQTEILKVSGIIDQGGADAIAQALRAIDGVSSVQVSLAGKRATVMFDETLASRPGLEAAVKQAGFSVDPGVAAGCCGGCGG